MKRKRRVIVWDRNDCFVGVHTIKLEGNEDVRNCYYLLTGHKPAIFPWKPPMEETSSPCFNIPHHRWNEQKGELARILNFIWEKG